MGLKTRSSFFIRYRIAPAIPVVQLLLSVYSSCFELNFDAGNTVGYSLITSVVYCVFFFDNNYKYCYIPKFSTLGLVVMSICDLTEQYTSYNEYSALYDFVTTIIVILLIAMAWLVNRKSKPRKL